MRTLTHLGLAALPLLCLFSCVKENIEPKDGPEEKEKSELIEKTFIASTELDEEVKTSLGSDKYVLWSKGDKIAVFDYSTATIGKCSEAHIFNLTAGEGTAKGNFTGKIHQSDQYCAMVVNSDKDIKINAGALETYIPSCQIAVEDSFQEGINPAWGIADELDNISFKNLGALVRFTVSESNICSIKMTSNDGSPMTGVGTYSFKDNNPGFVNTTDIPFVELKPDGDFFDPGDYYAIIYPGTHNKGVTLEYARIKDGKYQTGSISSQPGTVISAHKSQIINIGSQESKVSWTSVEGLVLDIKFNEDGTATDASAYNHNIETFPSTLLKTAYNKDFGGFTARFSNNPGIGASDGYYKYDYSNDSRMKAFLSGSHSWETYLMPNDTTGWWSSANAVKFWGTTQGGGTDIYFNTVKNSHTISFAVINSSGSSATANSGVNAPYGKFVHIVGVFDASANTVNVYVDGVLKKSSPFTGTVKLPEYDFSQWIGLGVDPGNRPLRTESAFNGEIAVARLYSKALTASEVSASYDAITKISNDSDLILSVKYDEKGNANDASRFNRTIQTMGSAPEVEYSIEAGGFVPNYANVAGSDVNSGFHQFNYSSDNAFKNALYGSSTMELYCAINEFPSTGNTKILASSQTFGLDIACDNDGKFYYEAYDGGQDKFVIVKDSEFSPVAGRYYHIVGVYDSQNSVLKFYRDGQKIGQQDFTGPVSLPSVAAAQRMCIGADPTGTAGTAECALNGAISLANVYAHAMSDADVALAYSRVRKISDRKSKPASASDLLLDIRFRQNGEAFDNSPFGRTVTTVPDTTMTTVFDVAYGDYVGMFIHKPGSKPTSGYAYFDYQGDSDFKAALEDGFTVETYASTTKDLTAALGGQMCCVSSMNGGGMSFFIPKGTKSTWKFGVYTTPDGGSGSYKNVDSGISPDKNTYNHIVGVYDKAGELAKIYINGELKGSLAAAGTYSHPGVETCHRIVVGSDPNATAGVTETPFCGNVAFARVYNSVKSDAEIKALYDGIKKTTTANLLLDVKFNKDWNAYDASGRNRSVERIEGFGAQTWFSKEYNDYVAFISNKMSVSAPTGYYKYNYATDSSLKGAMGCGVFSFETYMMADCESKSVKFLSAQETGGCALYINASGKFGFQVVTNKNGVNTNVTATSTTTVQKGKFYHVVGVVDYPQNLVSIYVNGVLGGTAAMKYKYSFPASSNYHWLGIGCDAGPTGQGFLHGDIAYAKIYGTALTAAQVQQAYNDINKISDNTPERPLKVSLIGDSISTFRGWIGCSETRYTYRAHYPNIPSNAGSTTYGLTHVYQTYWWRFTYDYLSNAMLDTNIAWSGSAVCDDGYVGTESLKYPCYCQRIKEYGLGHPDVILVHGGTNDWAHNKAGLYAKPGTKIKDAVDPIPDSVLETMYANRADLDIELNFAAGYIHMMYLLQRDYPNAKIVAIIGDYMNEATVKTIRKICDKFGIHYVDLYAVNGFNDLGGKKVPPYVQPNMPKHDFDPVRTDGLQTGCHPNPEAMDFIANKIFTEQGSYIEGK